MAKKKKGGKGGKGGKAKAKSDLTALEKKTLLIAISVLESKLNRKEELCSNFQEMINVYREKYESESKEKESIVIHLQKAIKKAINFKQLQRKNLAELEKKQQLEMVNLQNQLLTTESDMISVREALTEENSFLNRRLDALERFKSEIDIINASILKVEEYLPQELKRFGQRMIEKADQARALTRCIRLQVAPLMAEKAGIFQLNIAKGIDPAYIKTIKESIRIEDLVHLLSKSVNIMARENAELEEKLHSRQQEHKMKMETGRAMATKLKVQRKLVSVLQEKELEQAKKISLVCELRERNKRHGSEIGELECSLSSIKDKMCKFRKELNDNENLIRGKEEQLSFENKLFQKLESVISQTQELIHKEVVASMERNIVKPEYSLLIEMFNFFSASLKDFADERLEVPSHRESTPLSPEESQQLVTYTLGDCGILFTMEAPPKMMAERELWTKKDATVQTEEKAVFDIVSANILADIGLLNKFETRTLA